MRIRRAIGYDPRSKGGRPSIITPEMEQRVLDHIALYNDLYQEEIIDFLYDEYGIKPSQSTISKLLKRLKITRKQLKGIAAKQNQELIDQWHDNARFQRANQIICIDESAFNEHTSHKKYGQAPQGLPAKAKVWLKRSKRQSFLPAYTIDGYEEPLIYQGSITQVIFEDWMENKILQICNPWPGPRSIIVMDNCSIHRSQRILNMCKARGIWVRQLPPYSPSLNPIKESFHDIKCNIRKNYKMQYGDYPDFPSFLITTIRRVGRGPEAAKKQKHTSGSDAHR